MELKPYLLALAWLIIGIVGTAILVLAVIGTIAAFKADAGSAGIIFGSVLGPLLLGWAITYVLDN